MNESRFKGHNYHACLPPEIYFPTLKFQVDRQLGKAFTALQLHIAGLHYYGYIDKIAFEKLTARYSKPLKAEAKQSMYEQQKHMENIKRLESLFSNVIEQWPKLSEKAKQSHIAKAREYVDKVPNAKLVLALASENSVVRNHDSMESLEKEEPSQ